MTGTASTDVVAAVRDFNRYYTAVIGALDDAHLRSPYTLTEVRVLYELAQQPSVELVALRRRLALDAGYLTRILTRFAADGLVTRERSVTDGRRQVAALTTKGRSVFAGLNRRASRDVERLLAGLGADDLTRLREALATVRALLDQRPGRSVTLRDAQPGDLGWVVERHGALYAAEYGWDARFEALVARIVADYAERHDPARERVWIAEVDGRRAGCIMCVRGSGPRTAKLRLLLVEPSARGCGVGRRLVDACVGFARDAGYRRMTLWTQQNLTAARRIYAAVGFRLTESAPHHSFGAALVEEVWSLDL